ncbi:MAG TPA: hypothetical protein VJH04_01275 [archaeon]|nr:hypothetical protein [archaeon]
MKSKSTCQRCSFTKETNYGNEKCPNCGGHMSLVPIKINGEYFL